MTTDSKARFAALRKAQTAARARRGGEEGALPDAGAPVGRAAPADTFIPGPADGGGYEALQRAQEHFGEASVAPGVPEACSSTPRADGGGADEPSDDATAWVDSASPQTRLKLRRVMDLIDYLAPYYNTPPEQVSTMRALVLAAGEANLDSNLQSYGAVAEHVRFMTDREYAIAKTIEETPAYAEFFKAHGEARRSVGRSRGLGR